MYCFNTRSCTEKIVANAVLSEAFVSVYVNCFSDT